MRRGLSRSIAVAAAGLVSAGLTVPVATAMESQPRSENISPDATAVHQLDAEVNQVTEYWTPERMRSAVPMDELVSAEVSAAVLDGATPSVGAEPRTVPGTSPRSFPTEGAPWVDGGDVVETAGRVFFTFDGNASSCSGNAVTSENRSVVITAGHCVKYQGSWHTDWIFVPGYDDGAAPHGEWAATTTLTTPQWEADEDMNYDVGAAVVAPLDGEHLTDVVGAQGVAFNQERDQDMYSFGYPAADPYDGTSLIYCSGTTFTDFLLTDDHGMGCDMTGGSSGGPWFLDFDEATGTGVQASVNSFGYTFLPGTMFGPYFGAEAEALYEQAQAL